MNIAHWPKAERPREKLLAHGAAALSDAELLAIFIRTGIKGKTAVDLARELLNNFGDLRSLLDADMKTLCQFRGLGIAKYAKLQASLEISRRYLFAELSYSDAISGTSSAKTYLAAKLRHATQEIFACLFLNSQNQVLAYEELFYGSINQAAVYPREIVRRALKHNAAAVIFAHNHFAAEAKPSEADKNITKKLKEFLLVIDVKLLDHLIIGKNTSISLAECGGM
jgi:DNA repair protein RadC